MKYLMKHLTLVLVSLILTLSFSTTHAGIEVREFTNKDQETLYNQLMFELRCLVCQNENLAASNAELAKDLRDEVYEMVTEKNLGEKEVKEFLVARYGDFVLYKPPVKKSTWLLWFGPFVMLLIGFSILLMVTRRNQGSPETQRDVAKRNAKRDEVRKILDSED